MTSGKKTKIIYWSLTVPVVVMILMGGLAMLSGAAPNIEGMAHLGYPAYLCKIIGTAKVLGVIAILYGRIKVLKEWAYAGFTINLLGASASHAFSGDELGKVIAPLVILAMVLGSYVYWKKLKA